MATVTGGPWPPVHLNSPVNTYYRGEARPVITFAPSLLTRHWGRVPSVHGISMVDSVTCDIRYAECSRAPGYIINGYMWLSDADY